MIFELMEIIALTNHTIEANPEISKSGVSGHTDGEGRSGNGNVEIHKVVMSKGDMFVKKGVTHRPVAEGGASILIIEKRGAEAVTVGVKERGCGGVGMV